MSAPTPPTFKLAYLHPRHWPLLLAFSLLWLAVLLPLPAIHWLGKQLGRLSLRLLGSRRRVAARNLELAFPELDGEARRQLLINNFENVGRAVLEVGIAWFWPDWRIKQALQVEGWEHVEQAHANGQGMLLLSCHFLTLELHARAFGIHLPGVGVYRPNNSPVFEYFQYHGRTRSNRFLVDRFDVRAMIKALRQGYALWYAPDHDYGRRASVFVPFLGVEQAATVTGTATLAKVRNVVTLPTYLIRRQDGGYKLIVEPPLNEFPCGDENSDAARCNAIIGEAIRRWPDQYMWLHRRFKTRPDPSEPSLY